MSTIENTPTAIEKAIAENVFPLFAEHNTGVINIRNNDGQYECGILSGNPTTPQKLTWHRISGLPAGLCLKTLEDFLNKSDYVTSPRGNIDMLVVRPLMNTPRNASGKAPEKPMTVAQEIAKSAFPQESQERDLRACVTFCMMTRKVFPLFSQHKTKHVVFRAPENETVECGFNGTWVEIPGMVSRIFTLEVLSKELIDYGFTVDPVINVGSGKVDMLVATLPADF